MMIAPVLAEITEETNVVPNGWEEFWERFRNFFWKADESGFNYLTRILIAIGIIVVAFFLIQLISHLIKKGSKAKNKGPHIDSSASYFVAQAIKVVLWVPIAFLVIAVLKIDTTGIAGVTSAITVALGLALQDIIGCFASGLVVIHQKHILAGDFIHVENGIGSVEGIVVRIQVMMTYLKTPAGQEVTIPNSNMQKAMITNYTRLGRRRLDYNVGVAYDTDIAKAKKVLMDLVENDERRLKDAGFEVYVYELGAYAVGLRLRLWTSTDDYWPVYNGLGEKVLLAFKENGIYIPSSTDRTIMK